MNFKPSLVGVGVLMLVSAGGIAPAPAALPSLDVNPWFGHFLAYENKKFTFGLDSSAVGKLTPLGKSGKPIGKTHLLPVTLVIEEVLPNGRTVTRKIQPDTLETKDPATAVPGKVSFRGKITGGASFEVHLEVERGVVSIGGRLLDRGTLTKNPLRFSVRATVPSAYDKVPMSGTKAAKAFGKVLKDDRLAILRTDGKRMNLTGADKLAPEPKQINGPGLAELKVEVSAYQGKVIEFSATPNSRMELSSRLEQPVHDGFAITWYPDPVKDPEGKSRLKFAVK
ncbi:MAG: hypothetical protein NTW21_20755 [Verrucomicrobia bacterium]|nr:hypothetical protein [Verrucomicrobiota bacterium]